MNLWPRVGVSIAIVAAFCIAVTEFLQATTNYELWKWQICAGIEGVGVVLVFIGRSLNARMRRAHEAQVKSDPQAGEFEGPPLFMDLTFWSLVLVFCGVSMVFITPMHRHVQAHGAPAHIVAKARSVHTNAAIPSPIQPTRFPSVVLQGISYRTANSSVFINGKTLFVGDRILGATVVNITRTTATLELDGQFKVLVIER